MLTKIYMGLKEIPFTYHWIVRRLIGGDINTVLDIGCGNGEFMEVVSKGKNWVITGVDLHDASLKHAKQKSVYSKLIKSDVVKISKEVTRSKYDLVFCSQVIEHLNKKDGLKAMRIWEKLAKKRVLVSTPLDFIPYHRIELTRKTTNPLNVHLSGWTPDEFEKLGYTVYGQGSKLVYGENGLLRKTSKIFWPLLILLSFIISVFVYYFPNFATYIVAVKNK